MDDSSLHGIASERTRTASGRVVNIVVAIELGIVEPAPQRFHAGVSLQRYGACDGRHENLSQLSTERSADLSLRDQAGVNAHFVEVRLERGHGGNVVQLDT